MPDVSIEAQEKPETGDSSLRDATRTSIPSPVKESDFSRYVEKSEGVGCGV